MLRPVIACVCVAIWAVLGGTARADQDAIAPTTYEVLINGESFRVEADRATKVQSARKPGAEYKLVVRIAQTQVLRLNTVRLEYDMPASVTDNRSHRQRTVEIKHQLGFSIQLTDLGGPLEAAAVEPALKTQVDALAEMHSKEKATTSGPITGKFAGAQGPGRAVKYTDARGKGHTCLVYLLSGPKFSVVCVIQYLDEDKGGVLTHIKRVLDSIAALP